MKEVIKEGHAHAAAGASMFVYYGRKRAVLIHSPQKNEVVKAGVKKINRCGYC